MTVTEDVISQSEPQSKQRLLCGDLEAVLSPVEPEVFFSEYWNKKALHIPSNTSKFSGLFDRAGFLRTAQHCGHLKVGFTDEKGWPGHFDIKPDQIEEMLASGKTVCASIIDPDEPILTAFLNDYRKSFRLAGKFSFNSYLSPNGAGFGLHLDHHPVSILQLEGQKRWWYSEEPGLKEVITNVSFPLGRDVLKLPWVTVQRPAEESLRDVVLNPGDVLYLPKGCWHRAQAIGDSLALTLAMESVSLLELIQAALLPKINTVEFRNALSGYPASRGVHAGIPGELETVFASGLEKLRATINDISPKELYAIWEQVEGQAQTMRLRAETSSAAARSSVKTQNF